MVQEATGSVRPSAEPIRHASQALPSRVDWVDYGKGFCIIFVVMMHSTLGVEKALGETGWMGLVVEWARPFRMPDFFLIAGLFLSRSISRSWRDFLDRKVLHFAYFYFLWLTIQFGFRAPAMAGEIGWAGAISAYFNAYINPYGTLWFIYLLPVFFVVVKLTRKAPAALIWSIGAALEIADIHTGNLLVDETASRFVYFYSGYLCAPVIFRFADWIKNHWRLALLGLPVWGVFNGVLVFSGYGDLPFVSLGLGFLGAAAVVALSALLAKSGRLDFIRFCGAQSIVIYLGFFLPMVISRLVLLKTGLIDDIGTMSVIVTTAGVLGALMMWWVASRTPFAFLYRRPDWARLSPQARQRIAPAE
ncbi:MAG: acyltransferase family protein [Pseudomonadota bacterium]